MIMPMSKVEKLIKNGEDKRLAKLLNQSPSLATEHDSKGRPLLHKAISAKMPISVQIMLRNGADPHEKYKNANALKVAQGIDNDADARKMVQAIHKGQAKQISRESDFDTEETSTYSQSKPI